MATLRLVPVLMGVVVVIALLVVRQRKPRAFWIVNAASGGIVAYLMNSERLRVHDESGAIVAQLTGWFWLGLISAVGVAISALAILLRRKRRP